MNYSTLKTYLFLTTLSTLFSSLRVEDQFLHLEDIFEDIDDTYVANRVQRYTNNFKYILLWTDPLSVPFVYMGQGQKGFIINRCPYTNCYSTSNSSLLGDITKFNLIVFNAPQLLYLQKDEWPKTRSPNQKYVFASIESADNYPICDGRLDGFFNWTWTYKLNSDARWGYLVIRDNEQNIVGPSKDMQWMNLEDMDPVSEELKNQLKTKTIAAAWFVSNCYTKSKRENYVNDLIEKLASYNLNVDVYGDCGPLKCERNKKEECEKIIKKKYYFYLAFENSFADDYVTEKLLHALQNNAVPIVYGGANYTRFMPDGIYLNARQLGVKALAKKMHDLINSPSEYAEYFRWKNHYSFYGRMENVETNDYCMFCAMLNDKKVMKKKTVYKDFKKWWMGHSNCLPNIFLFNISAMIGALESIHSARKEEVLPAGVYTQ